MVGNNIIDVHTKVINDGLEDGGISGLRQVLQMISHLAPAENNSPAHHVMGLISSIFWGLGVHISFFFFSFLSASLQRLVTDDGCHSTLDQDDLGTTESDFTLTFAAFLSLYFARPAVRCQPMSCSSLFGPADSAPPLNQIVSYSYPTSYLLLSTGSFFFTGSNRKRKRRKPSAPVYSAVALHNVFHFQEVELKLWVAVILLCLTL